MIKGAALLVSEVFPPQTGGSGRWFWELYRRLSRRACVIVAGEHDRQRQFDEGHDLRVHRMPLAFSTWGIASGSGVRQYARALRRLDRLVKEEDIRILHCGKCLPEGLLGRLVKGWRGLRYICYVHGEELNLAAKSRELRWLTARVLAGADFVIANSRSTCELLRQRWRVPGERVRLLHPGVDTTRLVPAPRDAAWRARSGWHDRPVVLTASRLQKRKGHDVMVQALTAIARSIPDVLYVIVGAGAERAALGDLVDRLGLGNHVLFMGEVTDEELVRCYQQCDLFVLPNRDVDGDIEGFGMVLLEAQSCGAPVVAGLSGGTADTMQVPETGRLVSCDGPDELARVVAELLSDPSQLARMREAARAWIVGHFDWSPLAARAAELLGLELFVTTGVVDA